MKKLYTILPDKSPDSFCAKGLTKAFKRAGYFTKKEFSSQLDNNEILSFEPDIILCFNFNELKEGLFDKIKETSGKTLIIFYFLEKFEKEDKKNIKRLNSFTGKKLLFTADKSNLELFDDITYLPAGVNEKRYKTVHKGYADAVTIASNPDNINVLKLITDLIKHFGEISIFCEEYDYLKSLDNELWEEINDERILSTYKDSYKGNFVGETDRAEIFSSSFANIVPVTTTPSGVDYTVYEIAASGGFAFCEYTSETERLFDSGREIEIYKNTAELIDKISFYMKNTNIAKMICENARRAAVNNHSASERVRRIIKAAEEYEKANGKKDNE